MKYDTCGGGSIDDGLRYLARLRGDRLARLQDAMRTHDVPACLLLNEPNIRYATGASAMPIYSMSTFVRCALVPADGRPILFEHANSMHRSRHVVEDVRPMHAWEFYDNPATEAAIWAGEIAEAIRELGVDGERLAVDRLGTPGFLALQNEGVTLVDSGPLTQEAREVKTPEEIQLFEINGAIVVDMLSAFEAALVPGIREQDLLAVLSNTMLRAGGEYLATSTVCSGPNTNPWRFEATDRAIGFGDLVYVDTDTVGIEGYFFCVSRTFLCGDGEPTRAQRDTYKAAFDWLEGLKSVVKPGLTCAELAIDRQSNPDRVIQENMTLVVELYAGEVGADHGVKLGDEVLVTNNGLRILAPYPYSARLLR